MDLQQVEDLVDAATALIEHLESSGAVDELNDLNLQSKLTNLKAAVDAAATPATPADGTDSGDGTATVVDQPADPAQGPVDETTPGE